MRVGSVAALAGVVALLGAGCSPDEEPVDEAVESPASDAVGEDPAGDADDGGGSDDPDTSEEVPADEDAGAEADAEAVDGPPLASTQHPVAEQDASLAIELRAEEAGDLLRVSLTFTPEGIEEGTSLAELLGSSGSGNGMSGRVIDADNLLEYGSVRAAVRHGNSVRVVDGQPVTLHFYVGAPQEPMERFDFLLDFGSGAPNWQGFVDVPYPGA